MTTKQMLLSALILGSINNAILPTDQNISEKQQKLNEEFLNAANFGKFKKVEQLLKKGANINAKNKYGKSALFFAVERGNFKVTQKLINAGADVNATNECGETILHCLAAYAMLTNEFGLNKEYIKIASLLIEHKINVNAQDSCGHTAAHGAARNFNIDLLHLLYDRGANLNTGNALGYTPLDTAQYSALFKSIKTSDKLYPYYQDTIAFLELIQKLNRGKKFSRT